MKRRFANALFLLGLVLAVAGIVVFVGSGVYDGMTEMSLDPSARNLHRSVSVVSWLCGGVGIGLLGLGSYLRASSPSGRLGRLGSSGQATDS